MARKDWKKHLLRVKQIADQNLGRVEKTEALTADLQVLEKRVELFQKVYYSMGKKLQACVQGTGQEAEKRMKKLPEYSLSQTLIESSSLLSLDTLLGHIFQICGDAHGRVANNRLTNELAIESNVLVPIHTLLETSIPTIQKHKRALQKMVLDMDSAKTRFMSAQKQQQQGNTSSAKVDGLRDEYDEACYRVDQCRDQLATEMFTLASREAELSHILLELIKCQADFHRKALESLEKRIPQMEEQIEFWTHMPVYGKPLDDHLRRTERRIALVIEECVKNLCLLGGLEEEGLFRIAGAANKVKKLKAAFDSEQCSDIADEYDVHCIAGALKQYLRELPDPLMNSALYPQWMQAAHLPADQRVQALADVIAMLPKPNYDNLRYIIKFMQKLSESQEINKMSPSNIAIVLGPNLIWPEGEVGPNVLTTSTQSAIVETLISNCDYFFPGDDDILEQVMASAPSPVVAMATPDLISSTAGEVGPGSPSPPPASVSVRTSTTPDLAQHGHPAQNLIGAVHGPGLSVSPTGSLENMAASTGSLTHADHGYSHGSVSPKPPRRDKKKPAPLPPGERPLGPAPPPPSKPSDVAALPYPVKPPLPDRPTDPATRGDGRPHSPGARSRSVGEKPEKPAKPDKPPEKLYPTLPRTRPASDSAQPARDASPPQPHRDLDKPPVPPPPTPDTPGHRRSGSSGARPPRPTPPPPPAHKPAALPEEAAPQGKSDEQTYL